MLIKKETEYAILGLAALAKEDGFVDVKVLAKKEHISGALLSKAFQKLVKAEILESQLGPNGGFRLKKVPERISLLEILGAIQGTKVMKCYEGDASYCPKANCVLRMKIIEIEGVLNKFLEKTTLAKIM